MGKNGVTTPYIARWKEGSIARRVVDLLRLEFIQAPMLLIYGSVSHGPAAARGLLMQLRRHVLEEVTTVEDERGALCQVSSLRADWKQARSVHGRRMYSVGSELWQGEIISEPCSLVRS